MVPRKGVDTVIRAAARLSKVHGIEAKLLIVGGEADDPDPTRTPEIGRLRAVAAAEGISERVVFTGRRSRQVLRYYYSAADVFVTTPWYEPFGITPVEAMACGIPVMGASVGGIKSTVDRGGTGFLVPPRDPDAVAERLAHLFTHPQIALSLGCAGRQRAQRYFTWTRVARKIADVYARVAGTEREQRVVPPIASRSSVWQRG